MTEDNTDDKNPINIQDNNNDDKDSSASKRESEFENEMKINYSYPEPNDPNFQLKIYKKREFYYYKVPPRPDINDYNDIKDYRDNICGRSGTLHEHQAMIANFINPNTPYRGILLFHGLNQ